MPRPSHSDYVLQQLNNQREWGFLCDCCIVIGDIYFRAHRAVLTACSSYFRMMFIGQQQLTGNLSLSQAHVSAECFDLILQLMYLGRLVGVPSDFEELRSAMTFLQLYYVPRSLEEVREAEAPSPPFSQAKGSMLFGVRMYGGPPGGAGKGPRGEATTEVNGMREPSRERPGRRPAAGGSPPCKQGRSGALKGRLHRRFGRRYTCDCCGFVFSCERLLDEHSLTCNSRRALPQPQPGDPPQACGGRPVAPATAAVAAGEGGGGGGGGGEGGEGPAGDGARGRPLVKTEPEDTAATGLGDITVVQVADEGEEAAQAPAYGLYGRPPPRERGPGSWTDEEEEEDEEEDEEDEGPKEEVVAAEGGAGDSPLGPACELCGAALPESERAEHYVAHHMESVCACGKCGRILVKGGRLQEHAEQCLGAGGEQAEAWGQAEAESGPGPCACPVCGETFPGPRQLEEHVYCHRGAAYRCPRCPLAFEQEGPWAEHVSRCGLSPPPGPQRNARRRHVCGLCGKGFYQRCHLREHHTTHTREKEFACQLCGKEFLPERLLRLHLDMHRGDARYVCPRCGQGSYRKHEHLRHMVSHLAAGEVICEVCFQVFGDGQLLERHMDMHLHACALCGDKFKLKKDLSTHHLTSHTKKA
ncbi:LOW QUALITY PROTEIN: zinc finger and BTB domain-containing protein 1-like [Pristis pectinata]|uniref:LOW QUALITY PROTEIN: zinc finger and BTB domain-containing protein 1-like n=1 Tax=Pristis pectinata TaxID=685728 RepID=UPI00223D0B80|nr:LOW QUALITY PROTEIN: zinc finger and BTB domain-containing protein 1-like [Pristis pectinata]